MTVHITANPMAAAADDLERFALEECVRRHRIEHRVSALLLSDQLCETGIKLARIGAQVTVLGDPTQRHDIAGRILAAGLHDEISVMSTVLPELPVLVPDEPFDIIIFRCGLSTLPYDEARRLLNRLLRQLRIGGKLYVSVLGLHSELGEDYAGNEIPVEARFSALAPILAEKYDILHPVCLYTERNLFTLLMDCGASVLRTLTTTYGSVTGIAVRV